MTFVGLSIIIMRLGFQSVRVEDEVIYCSTTVGLETRVGRVCVISDKCKVRSLRVTGTVRLAVP